MRDISDEDREKAPDRFHENALSYFQAAHLLWERNEAPGEPYDYLVAPTLQCLAYFYELLCKEVLLRAGEATLEELCRKPYRHDIWFMWNTPALAERKKDAENYVLQLAPLMPKHFPHEPPVETFNKMLMRLSELNTNVADYALRYPTGKTEFYPPDVLISVGMDIFW